jgi:hypothetical protein
MVHARSGSSCNDDLHGLAAEKPLHQDGSSQDEEKELKKVDLALDETRTTTPPEETELEMLPSAGADANVNISASASASASESPQDSNNDNDDEDKPSRGKFRVLAIFLALSVCIHCPTSVYISASL